MARGAGLLLEADRLPGRQVVAVGAGLSRLVQVEGVVELAAERRDLMLPDTGVAGEALGLRVSVMARLAAGLAETHHLPFVALLVRPVAGGTIETGAPYVRLVAVDPAEDRPFLDFDPLVAAEAGRGVRRLRPRLWQGPEAARPAGAVHVAVRLFEEGVGVVDVVDTVSAHDQVQVEARVGEHLRRRAPVASGRRRHPERCRHHRRAQDAAR